MADHKLTRRRTDVYAHAHAMSRGGGANPYGLLHWNRRVSSLNRCQNFEGKDES